MKTSRFSENYDLCHPLLGCENSNNNSNTVASSYGHTPSTTVTSGVVTYGNSSTEPTSNFEKNANEFQIKQQRQQQQEQNKKRKRETGEYCFEKNSCTFCVSSSCPLFLIFLKNTSLNCYIKERVKRD
jgi:hypothetical protein